MPVLASHRAFGKRFGIRPVRRTLPEALPRPINLLTDLDCKRAKESSTSWDGAGLYLKVKGARYWKLKYSRLRVERLAGGGVYPAVSLRAARAWRDEFRRVLKAGGNPIADKRAAVEAEKTKRAKANTDAKNTVEVFATAHHGRIAKNFRNVKHRAQWLASLRPVFDKLGAKPLAAITETCAVIFSTSGASSWTAGACLSRSCPGGR